MSPKRCLIPIFVPHLGCPNACVFCNQNRISGTLSPARPEDVTAAVNAALAILPAEAKKTVAFYGGSFTAIPGEEQEALLGAVAPFLKDGRVEDIRLSTRPDAVDAETLMRLARFGVKTVELGAQSMCDEVLLLSKRGHTAADTRRAAGLIKNAGFELILQMMTGLPGDTPERSLFTARELIRLKPDGVRIYPTVLIKDTELCDMWREGRYSEHTVEAAVELSAQLLDMFEAAGIPVIRLGLNPTDELSGGDAVGGAYHPALRELAEARRFLRRERELLAEADRGKAVLFLVPRGKISQAVGQKRENARTLEREFSLDRIKFAEYEGDTLKRG